MYDTDGERVTIACENDAVPGEFQPRYIAAGTFVVDYSTNHSFEPSDAPEGEPKTAVAEAFNRLAEASRAGGIGTLRGAHTDLLAVGRFSSDGLGLIEGPRDGDKHLKTLQFSEYAVMGPSDDEYDSLSSISQTKGGTVAGLTEDEIAELQTHLERLEARGRFRTPVR
ncbi:hypothetical protein [Halobaculum sp. EA56]|uniref:hypothetical protein n=1 Tax=Halobaculum sp. EA56 TaxID=3421648 RepID=UPI003EB8EE2D